MRCRGEEKYCISYHETADGVSLLHSRGCATENFCKKEEMRLFPFDLDKVAACTIVSHEQPLPAGHFLWCPVCFGKELDVSSFLLCAADEDVCLFEATRTLYDGEEQVQYFRRCGMSHECSRRGSISSSKKTMSINTTCCHQSQCHCPEPELPALSDQRNGLICPDCHVSGSHLCLRKSIKRCSGDEDTCIQYTRSMKQDFSVMKEVLYGCASRSFCNAGPSRVLPMGGYGQHITTEVICNGGRHLTIPSSLCFIPALLIVICLQLSPLKNF
ncbi:phospholipase A2 inhibitor and Ly6/PLAUR domain-containing protein-like [Engystomops pustulosus]|uniref:phospholipase A2 inhibitor and Ly6/PLAUR domain-containing protein-like n=1 Tax=Engystomops pustulosus TaxID=76066 RepID=UPI003AFB5F12